MKTMTCKQLGGACDMAFQAETFEEIANLAKNHGTAMFQKGDTAHLEAMQKIRTLMQDPAAMQAWMAKKKEAFEMLQEDSP